MIVTGSSVAGNASNNNYLGIFEDAQSPNAGFTNIDTVFGPTPRAGTVKNLIAEVDSGQSLITRGWTITVNAGSTPPGTSIDLCQFFGAATGCSSLNTTAVPAGSYLTVRVTSVGTSVQNRRWRFSFEY